jgi:hypothetical protein
MHKNAMKCNKTLSKWCKNNHGASKIIDTLETYQIPPCPMIWNKPTSKGKDKQTMNTSASFLFTIGIAFFLDASSNVHYRHAVNFHHELCMA